MKVLRHLDCIPALPATLSLNLKKKCLENHIKKHKAEENANNMSFNICELPVKIRPLLGSTKNKAS